MEEEEQISGRYKDILNVTLILCQEDVKSEAFELSFGEDVDINQVLKGRIPQRLTEGEAFHQMGMRYIPAELRWNQELSIINPPNLVDLHDIRGIVHTHTLYSDGIHSVKEMSEFAKDNGFDYIAISDHSRSAFYANGLSVERIEQQHREIDAMAKEFNGFKIFKR
jgi:DNA polymerase (family 10)